MYFCHHTFMHLAFFFVYVACMSRMIDSQLMSLTYICIYWCDKLVNYCRWLFITYVALCFLWNSYISYALQMNKCGITSFFFTIFNNCHNELDCNSQCNLVSLFTIYVLQLNEKERLFPLNPFFFATWVVLRLRCDVIDLRIEQHT